MQGNTQNRPSRLQVQCAEVLKPTSPLIDANYLECWSNEGVDILDGLEHALAQEPVGSVVATILAFK